MFRFTRFTLPLVVLVFVATGMSWYALSSGPVLSEARELRAFVRGTPPVPVVFTSRTDLASLHAAAPEGEGFHYPGTIPWAAREGRLRLLQPDGKVYELTWGRMLPDGGTLIDVMSPSVSLDGQRILFAGRKGSPDPGRWRIYQINRDGSDLRPLTGGQADSGCTALPPLRFAAAGSPMSDGDRRQLDYDDVDPADLGPDGFAFASSRLPDLGRDHARRATQIWKWVPGAENPTPMTANRYNDRWPVLAASNAILFSMWSRNREAITADLTDLRPVSSGGSFATRPADHWMAAVVTPNHADFRYAVKASEPVWRPRPLFNGRIAFMTENPGGTGRYRIAQASEGYLAVAPSSARTRVELPQPSGDPLTFGPVRDAEGRELTVGCPSACPPGSVLFAAAAVESAPEAFGIYCTSDDWSGSSPVPQLLFDDPTLVDAEPVAIYARTLTPEPLPRSEPLATGVSRPAMLRLSGNREYRGPAGYFENDGTLDSMYITPPPDVRSVSHRRPPIYPSPDIRSVAIYAAHRDRFDDPKQPRIHGGWERLSVAPLNADGNLNTWLPADPLMPLVLAGLDAEGKIAKWKSPSDSYYAVAGDHYSGVRPDGYHYCVGCHTGHTFALSGIREKVK